MKSKTCFKNVAIVGAGPCGLATAIALRSKGIDAHIYEKEEGFKSPGVAIVLSHNGTYALKVMMPEIDIVNQIIQAGNFYKRFVWKSVTGEVLKELPRNVPGAHDTPAVVITWYNLKKILFDKIPKEAIHFGHSCTGFEQDNNGVNISFSNGKNVRADILIGADGLNSIVRKLICPEVTNPTTYSDQMSWQALIPYNDKYAEPDAFYSVLTPDKNIGWVNTGKNIYWIFSKNSEKNKHLNKSELLAEVVNWSEPVLSIIKDSEDQAIIERPLYEVAYLNRWYQNRVVIAGDSAHALMPTLGQGTSLSFEDAFELTRCLLNFSTIEDAFFNYEKNRRERISYVQGYSAHIKKQIWDKSHNIQQVSDEFKKLFSDESFIQWLFSYKVDKDYDKPNPLNLKNIVHL